MINDRVELVIPSLDIHRVLGVRTPHRRWVDRMISIYKPKLGIDAFMLDGSSPLIVEDGIVVSLGVSPGPMIMSAYLASCIVQSRRTEAGYLPY
jgi:hypothetical protein